MCDYAKRVFKDVKQTTHFGITAEASPLRSLHIIEPVLDMTDKVCHDSKEIRVLSKFADHPSMLVTASVLLGIWLVLGSTAMPLVTIMSLYFLHGYTSPTTPVHHANNETSQMKD